jgi:flavin-binding protein dodecin
MGIEKHIQVTGTSTISWKDAIVKTIETASETINYITSVRVLDQRAKVTGSEMTEYFADLDITFLVTPEQ